METTKISANIKVLISRLTVVS